LTSGRKARHISVPKNSPNPLDFLIQYSLEIAMNQSVAAWGLLHLAARHKDTILRNAYLKAKRQTERGASDALKGYLIPPSQHDELTAAKLIDKLTVQGFDIQKATDELEADGQNYPAGTYWIPLAQPKMGVIKTLLGRTLYPDDAWTRQPDGTPARPYDTSTDTIAEFMGVRVDPVKKEIEGQFETVAEHEPVPGHVAGTSDIGYAFDGKLNDSFLALNRLFDRNIRVTRVHEPLSLDDRALSPGAFVVPADSEAALEEIAGDLGISFYPLEKVVKQTEVMRPRLGMYQRYWGGNMDEGWTRLLLEQFEFPYQTLKDEEIKAGKLADRIDVLILPDDTTNMIKGKNSKERLVENPVPPEYQSGIGKKGVKAIMTFVEEGGTLITLNRACDFAIEKLDLPISNILKGKSTKEFFCPGSMLKAHIDTTHPLAFGMPEDALILCWNSPAFQINPSFSNDSYENLVHFPERDILQSGWLVGEEQIAEKSALISAQYGKGKFIQELCYA
jgi:hypothetical protein